MNFEKERNVSLLQTNFHVWFLVIKLKNDPPLNTFKTFDVATFWEKFQSL